MNKLVSIIVPTYKGEKFVKKCIDSLLKQTYSPIEIIVVYSPFPDATLEILDEYGNKINLIKESKKTNPATARNIGLRASKGEYISFCDADDFFAPTKIEQQIDVLSNNPNVGLVYTDIITVDMDGNKIKTECPEWNRNEWLSNRFIAFSSVLTRKNLLDKVGYFDERLKAVEDFDILIRLSEISEFKRVHKFLTYHRIHEHSLSRQIALCRSCQLQIYKKHKMYMHYADFLIWDMLIISTVGTFKRRMHLSTSHPVFSFGMEIRRFCNRLYGK